MMCLFLLYSKVSQLYVCIFPLPLEPASYPHPHPTHLVHHRPPSRAPCAIQQLPTSQLFYTWQCLHVNLTLPIHPTLPFPCPCIHLFVLYVYVSTSALQIRSSMSFFQILHICINMQYSFFSFCFTSLCVTVSLGPCTSLQMARFCSFLWLTISPL